MNVSGHTALVTGASSGIGEAFARELARRGAHLILVARSAGRLRALADDLTARHGVRVHVLAADLTGPEAAREVRERVEALGESVDFLVNNAGYGANGHFETLDPSRDRGQVDLNVGALVDLTHAFVPDMLARGRGTVVNVASTAGFQAVPYMAVYGATKAFVLSFSQALAEEFRGRGVHVLAVAPGATQTPFFDVAGEAAAVGRLRNPEQVVRTAMRALDHGRTLAVDGPVNAALALTTRLLPRSAAARIAGRAVRPDDGPAEPAAREAARAAS